MAEFSVEGVRAPLRSAAAIGFDAFGTVFFVGTQHFAVGGISRQFSGSDATDTLTPCLRTAPSDTSPNSDGCSTNPHPILTKEIKMPLHPAVIVTAMTVCAFAGGLGLKQFSVTRDILWLVAGFCAYGISNVLFVLVIDATGIARAMIVASSAQILMTAAAGFWLGEKLTGLHILAAVLVCVAVATASIGASE